MSKSLIRPMNENDLHQVYLIENQTFSLPWSEKDFSESIALEQTLYLVSEADGEIEGYCGCYQSFDEAEITNVAVRGSSRGKGIGTQLLTELFRLGESRGISSYILEVRVSNFPAIALYESLGFTRLGIRRDFYTKPSEDALIMRKDFKPRDMKDCRADSGA